jgi:hypothetical protein
MSERWRRNLAGGIVGLATLWFFIGLTAPLTPSMGPASPRDIVVFALTPILAVALSAQLVEPGVGRWLLRGLSLSMLVIAILVVPFERSFHWP